MDFSTKIELSAWIVALLAGTITPVLTGIVTKLEAHPGTKALIAVMITAVISVINAITLANGQFIFQDIVILFVTTFVWHVATYFGIWKPIGNGTAPGARATAEIGVG